MQDKNSNLNKFSFKSIFLNDNFIIWIIVIDAILIYCDGFGGYDLNKISNYITIFYVIEVLVKLHHYGFKKYFSSGWNRFDFAIVAISIIDLVSHSLIGLSALRVFRVVKTLRLIKFIPDIDNILAGLKRAMASSVFVILIFVIFLHISSVFTTNLFKEKSPEHFGNTVKSTYSIFKVITLEGWFDISESVAHSFDSKNPNDETGVEEVDGNDMRAVTTTIFFISIVFFGGIIGISLINSIFVETMMSDNNDPVNDKLKDLEGKLANLEDKIDLLLSQKNK